jgi:hypothetical protein
LGKGLTKALTHDIIRLSKEPNNKKKEVMNDDEGK